MSFRNAVGTLWAAVMLLVPSVGAAQDTDDDARTLFESATIQYERGAFREAAASFTAAYELSGRAPLLYNVYLAHRDAGQPAEAAVALRRYLEEMPPEEVDSQRTMLEERAANLEAQAARERSEPDDGGSEVVVEAPEQEPPPPEPGAPIGPIVLVAAGGAALIAGVATAFVTSGIESDLEDACPNQRCGPDQQGEIDRGKRMALVTDVLLIGGGAIALGGALWWILGRRSEDEIRTSASCVRGGCSVQLGGSF